MSSSTCSLQRKEEMNIWAPIQSQCQHHALCLKRQIEGSSAERWSNDTNTLDYLLNIQGIFHNYLSPLEER